jgi:hypothetical protein
LVSLWRVDAFDSDANVLPAAHNRDGVPISDTHDGAVKQITDLRVHRYASYKRNDGGGETWLHAALL